MKISSNGNRLGRPLQIWGSRQRLDLLLINTPLLDYRLPHPTYTIFQPPIGLAMLASFLNRQGFEVGVCDADTDKITPPGIAEEIKRSSPRWVGFNTFTSGFEVLVKTIIEIKKTNPGTKIMLGGVHATIASEDFLNLPELKDVVVVRNDGEYKIEALLRGRSKESVPGIGFINDSGNITLNQESSDWLVKDIDDKTFALNREFVPYDPTLGNLSPDGKKRAFIASSRGCPYECTYCASSRLARDNKPVRYRNAGSVVKEILDIIQAGVRDIKFNDELAWVSEKRIRDILLPLIAAGYGRNWGLELRGNGRANVIASLNDNTLDLMKEAGVKRIGIGVEQGTIEGMTRIKKSLTPKQVIIATTRLAQRGIPVLANFMFGLPEEDEKETVATVVLAKEIVLIGKKYGIPIEIDGYKYRPYPGTEIYEQLIAKGFSPEELRKVVHVETRDGTGSHLQLEPFLNLANIDPEIERRHRFVLDSLMTMTETELIKIGQEYPRSLCFETSYQRNPEKR